MDELAMVAASAVVTSMTTEGWAQARTAFVNLWKRLRPDHVPAVEAELDASYQEVKEGQAQEVLVGDWQRRLRRLIDADPDFRVELKRFLDEELTPLLPPAERDRIQNIQHITASAQGAIAQGVIGGKIVNYGGPAL